MGRHRKAGVPAHRFTGRRRTGAKRFAWPVPGPAGEVEIVGAVPNRFGSALKAQASTPAIAPRVSAVPASRRFCVQTDKSTLQKTSLQKSQSAEIPVGRSSTARHARFQGT